WGWRGGDEFACGVASGGFGGERGDWGFGVGVFGGGVGVLELVGLWGGVWGWGVVAAHVLDAEIMRARQAPAYVGSGCWWVGDCGLL
ncbi:hypothetical protein, partial [Pseudomonas syringae group genomosp. 7]|uniref:hypothetical protein n=1 Tax=Pseudomonas syringae group genomosp. 7 TaxID=251699 RepID=UPI00377032EE